LQVNFYLIESAMAVDKDNVPYHCAWRIRRGGHAPLGGESEQGDGTYTYATQQDDDAGNQSQI